MKNIYHSIHSALGRSVAIVGIGVLASSQLHAAPQVTLGLKGQDFGNKNGIEVTNNAFTLSPSTLYRYSLVGSVETSGPLSNIFPSGTSISSILNFITPGSASILSGTFENPSNELNFAIIEGRRFRTTKEHPDLGLITIDLTLGVGCNAEGNIYVKVKDVIFKCSKKINLGVIKFQGGTKLKVETAPVIQFELNKTLVRENVSGGMAKIKVIRFGNPNGSPTVLYSMQDDTATSDDYTASSGELTFANKSNEAFISVPIINNAESDGTRRFTITLSEPSLGSVLDTRQTTSVLISNDD